jgi:hypothetical protein
MSDPFQTPGAVSWQELMTTDVKAAEVFYASLLGWELEPAATEGVEYTIIKVGGRPVGGIKTKPDYVPTGVPPHWGMYVTVEDVEATVQKARELGATVLVPTTDIPEVGTFSVLRDPQGAVFSVMKYLPRSCALSLECVD